MKAKLFSRNVLLSLATIFAIALAPASAYAVTKKCTIKGGKSTLQCDTAYMEMEKGEKVYAIINLKSFDFGDSDEVNVRAILGYLDDNGTTKSQTNSQGSTFKKGEGTYEKMEFDIDKDGEYSIRFSITVPLGYEEKDTSGSFQGKMKD